MKIRAFLLASSAIVGAGAFSLHPVHCSIRRDVRVASSKLEDQDSWQKHVVKFLATGLVTASLWAAPAVIQQNPSFVGSEHFSLSSVANAKQMASASGSRVNKDPESLLRYGLPINSNEVCCVI
jgi:hypothetical protein